MGQAISAVIEKEFLIQPPPSTYDNIVDLTDDDNACVGYHATCTHPAPHIIVHEEYAKNGVLLFLHGNAQDLGTTRTLLQTVAEKAHVAVVAVEYPGYGSTRPLCTRESKGDEALSRFKCDNTHGTVAIAYSAIDVDMESTYMLVKAFVTFLVGCRKWERKHIVVWGHSLGGYYAARLAAEGHVGALALQSAFHNVYEICVPWASLGWMPGNIGIDALLGKITVPTLVMHGRNDRIVPVAHATKISAGLASEHVTTVVNNGTHSNALDLTSIAALCARATSTLRGADPTDSTLRGADPTDSTLRGADPTDSTLRGADPTDCETDFTHRGADSNGADLNGCET